MTDYAGGCHCGALEFVLRTGRGAAEWSVRTCQCAFCRAHAARSTSDPAGTIEFFERRPGALVRYRFAQKTADYLICGKCGVYVGAVIVTPRGRFGIVNVNALQPVPDGVPAPQAMNYDGESPERRTARREQRWSPVTGSV